MTDKKTVLGAYNAPEMVDYLLRRRSVPIKSIGGAGPDAETLQQILQIAARIPDHGRLCPWYFLTFTGAARAEIGKIVGAIYDRKNADASDEDRAYVQRSFERAPVVVCVVARRREGKTPWWEQILSAGAVCYNMVLAAQVSGFGAIWLTEWMAFDDDVKAALGLDPVRDHIAGFIHIGTMLAEPEERERPDLSKLVTAWEPGVTPQTGDDYDRAGFGFAAQGF